MKMLLIFAAALLSVQAMQVPYMLKGSSDSSEEQYSLDLPAKGQPGYGVLKELYSSDSSEEEYKVLLPVTESRNSILADVPIFRAIKLKVPRYLDPVLKQKIFAQALAARGVTAEDIAAGPLTKGVLSL